MSAMVGNLEKILKLGLGITLLFYISSCSNPEGKGQEIYETGQFEEQQNNLEHARQLYQEIIKDYPETQSASKARERLKALEKE